jgi:hypothetical protein
VLYKFYLGQAVPYRAARGLYAASGAYVVTAKLAERHSEYKYRIRNLAEAHERTARQSDLRAITADDGALAAGKEKPS